MLREPVRGGLPDRAFYRQSGLDRARAYVRGTVPRPPLSHLFGYRVTQVGPGTATLMMPVSPWLLTLDEQMVIDVLIEAALATAALTAAPAETAVAMTSISTSRFRPVTPESTTLVARARTLSTARTLNFGEVVVLDALGRQVLHATGAAVFRPVAGAGAGTADLGDDPAPLERPTYPTPDPYLRPLPPGVGTIPRQLWEDHDGPAIARMYAAGQLPKMPVGSLVGLEVSEWDEGRIEAGIRATEWLAAFDRQVSPGILALVTDAALGGTTALKLEARRLQVGIVEDTISFYRQVPCDGRKLLVTGRITHRPANFVVSESEVSDADGNLVAVGHRTSVFLEARTEVSPRRDRRLLAVLFTDIVDSTGTAAELGDERWSQLLGEHHRITRHQLDVHGGREVKTTGDGFLATFDSPGRALQAARAIRDGLGRLGLRTRAGLHVGECDVSGADVAGIAVHIAARIQALAAPDEILLSGTVRDLVVGSGLHFEPRGEHQLKGVDGCWPVFAVGG